MSGGSGRGGGGIIPPEATIFREMVLRAKLLLIPATQVHIGARLGLVSRGLQCGGAQAVRAYSRAYRLLPYGVSLLLGRTGRVGGKPNEGRASEHSGPPFLSAR